MAPTVWTPGARVVIGTGGAVFDRNSLVPGVDKPTYNTVGCPPEIIPFLSDVTSPTIITTDNTVLDGYNFLNTVDIRADNVKITRSIAQGPFSTPADGSGLIACSNIACSNALIEDVTISPRFAHWNWDSGIVGHDYTARRVLVRNTTDGMNVFNLPLWNATGTPYQSGVTIEMCLIERLALWNALSNGVVHPGDIQTHNDGIQHQGGLGTVIRGNVLIGKYARQYAHWVMTSTGTAEASLVPPYTGVALQTLPAGQPWYGGPFQASANLNTIPDRNTGSEADGRYNVGGQGSLNTLLIGDEVGPSGDMNVDRNWFYGGEFAVNGGGAINTGSAYTMTFTGNRYSRDQGNQGSGGNGTHTINFQQTEHSWTGFLVATGNVYEDNNAAVTVRT